MVVRKRRGMNHRNRSLALVLLGAIGVALLSIATPVLSVRDTEGVCKWEDEEGEKKCKDEADRRNKNKDNYLPDNEGGGYYGYGYGYGHGHVGDDVWKHGTKGDIYEELDCPSYDYDNDKMFKDTSFENIHTAETWAIFNRIYNEVIAAVQDDSNLRQESSIPPVFEKHGFQFPIEIKFDPVVGRGVYSKTDIPKGSLLYLPTNNAAFYNGQTYRNFLRALPSKLACDVLIWAFVRWVSLESNYNNKNMVCVDLDEGSFINTPEGDDDKNMVLGDDKGELLHDMEDETIVWYGCKMKFYAFRDIVAGEEIRASYSDFAEVDNWKYLGLQ